MKIINIHDAIYEASIYVIPESTIAELVKYFKKHGVEYKEGKDAEALHYKIVDPLKGLTYHYLIFEKFQNTPYGIAVLNHEIYHLHLSVLGERGLILSGDSEEAFAYYFQYLTEKILGKLIK